MRFGFVVPVLAATLLASLTATNEAEACGGCFAPPSQSTVVSAHRMALSISPKQTVLWDQIQYNGDPESFAWVLPVKPGAVIEVSTDAWFDTLDAATTTQIFQAPVDCGNGSSGGFGCSESLAGRAFSDAEGGSNGGGGPSVTVVHRGTVGPYQTVTLSTDTPGALNTWLDVAGYDIDPSTQPVIDAYIAEKFDFIAIKLVPGKDVKAMTPVRVVQPGISPTLPLRMVAIGSGANVAITLFMITEGRWEAKNFNNVVAPVDLLSWDFKTQSSNYGELRTKVLEQNGGASWLTAFAFEGGLLSQLPGLFSFQGFRTYTTAGNGNFADSIAAAYVQQGIANGETADGFCSESFANVGKSGLMVSNPCPAGVPLDDPSCGEVASGEIDARTLACGPLDDLAVALNGLHPKDVWLTRLEANLPRAALESDLVLQPAASQETVDNMHQARIGTNVDVFCGDGSAAPIPGGGKKTGDGRGPLVVAFGMALAALAAAARRRMGITRA
ncbi:DUF2330 domain-containing protein [Polyangium jinanense]|uniref:DUF2330 domain-containing protein n=1 Tax=Polyangium jinanense TaxID=2829994 RepID=A0A9X3X3M5_9BACT|nr:DUF2330 domain-containing protein [Polyangium jinanense]MDC3954144.1 DUF2330 domain-containing protein [Polyangium jinanense]MDC3981900.1 DUF2330 domain-containing protein [Polyangium jinanense]